MTHTDTADLLVDDLPLTDNRVLVGEAGPIRVLRFRETDYPFPTNSPSVVLAAQQLAANPESPLPPVSTPSEVNAYGVPVDAWVEVAA